jgi:HEAT repeat protein
MRKGRTNGIILPPVVLAAGAIILLFLTSSTSPAFAQASRNLTPIQIEIEKQQQRLSSGSDEEKRDALMRLGAMRLPAASRAALPGLSDVSPMVRAVATKSILSLGGDESAAALLPLLNDKDEFVRREAAYALGATRSKTATTSLTDRLLNDKEAGVRGAAAVALGRIADEAAVIALGGALAPELSAPAKSKRKRESNEFVLRAAATALGQIKSRAGTAALISALTNEKFSSDVRREAARSLGLIGDPAAVPALRTASSSPDPFLSQLAYESLRKLNREAKP